ncbi:MAG: hypothetical protein AB1757_12920 [Acidobacteriota bacterium]
MADTVVFIGNLQRTDLIKEFYQKCGLETTKSGKIGVGDIVSFTDLEDLISKMLKRSESTHILISHGNINNGLLIKFGKSSQFNATGLIIKELSALADLAQKTIFGTQTPAVVNLASMMGLKAEAVINLAKNIADLRLKKIRLEIRGCNVGANPTLLQAYKTAFNASSVTAPSARMFYLRIAPHKPRAGKTMGGLTAESPTTSRTRRRNFFDPSYRIANQEPLIIDVRDIDGHSSVDSESFMNIPSYAARWAKELCGEWRQAPQGIGNDRFVLPVIWDDNESSYHVPLDDSYKQKLATV